MQVSHEYQLVEIQIPLDSFDAQEKDKWVQYHCHFFFTKPFTNTKKSITCLCLSSNNEPKKQENNPWYFELDI